MIAVDRQRKVVAPAGVRVHRWPASRSGCSGTSGRPAFATRTPPSTWRCGDATEFDALAVLAAACQSRRTTARRLLAQAGVPRAGCPTRLGERRAPRRGGGDLLRAGALLPPPGRARARAAAGVQRQVRAVASAGVVYRDVDYGRLIVELDGRLFHDSTEQRDRDFERDLDAALDGRRTVRLSWGQVYGRSCSTAGKLGALLQVHGWRGGRAPVAGPTAASRCPASALRGRCDAPGAPELPRRPAGPRTGRGVSGARCPRPAQSRVRLGSRPSGFDSGRPGAARAARRRRCRAARSSEVSRTPLAASWPGPVASDPLAAHAHAAGQALGAVGVGVGVADVGLDGVVGSMSLTRGPRSRAHSRRRWWPRSRCPRAP